MKTGYIYFLRAILPLLIIVFLVISCKKLNFDTITKLRIEEVTVIDSRTIHVEVNIFSLSNDDHPDYGVCYSNTSTSPSMADKVVSKGILSKIKKLIIIVQDDFMPGDTIYLKAFAMDGNKIQYGLNVKKIVPFELPVVTTLPADNITLTNATLKGMVNANGLSVNVYFEYGTTISYGKIINASPFNVTGVTNTNVSATTTVLQENTLYHYRTKIVYTGVVLTGNDRTFKTQPVDFPTVTTAQVTNITLNSASSGGNVTHDGGSPVFSRGVCWGTSENPNLSNYNTNNGNGTGTFSSSLLNLNPNTTYYVRAFAINSKGTSYGNQQSFTTLSISLPSVTTAPITNITINTAVSGGNVTSDGGSVVTARGVCWSTSTSPTLANSHSTNGNNTGTFISSITGLSSNKTYYVRAYATNAAGTQYGEQRSLTTLIDCPNTFTDPRDGKIYGAILIGTQCWMKQNINIGTRISSSNNQTNNGIIEKYCYSNSESSCNTYGGLYQWDESMQYSSTSGSKGICPSGWHIPKYSEFLELAGELGLTGAGGKMKQTGTSLWKSPNTGATNSSNFTGLPGGYRDANKSFYDKTEQCYLTTSDTDGTNPNSPWFFMLHYNDTKFDSWLWTGNNQKYCGHSVRCIKNE